MTRRNPLHRLRRRRGPRVDGMGHDRVHLFFHHSPLLLRCQNPLRDEGLIAGLYFKMTASSKKQTLTT